MKNPYALFHLNEIFIFTFACVRVLIYLCYGNKQKFYPFQLSAAASTVWCSPEERNFHFIKNKLEKPFKINEWMSERDMASESRKRRNEGKFSFFFLAFPHHRLSSRVKNSDRVEVEWSLTTNGPSRRRMGSSSQSTSLRWFLLLFSATSTVFSFLIIMRCRVALGSFFSSFVKLACFFSTSIRRVRVLQLSSLASLHPRHHPKSF